jgi:virginiamycin B lyase
LLATVLALLVVAPAAQAWVYWGHWTYGAGVGRAGLDGSQVNDAFIPAPAGQFTYLRGVAVDSNYLYWGTHDLSASATTIGRAPLTGANPNYSFTAVTSRSILGLGVNATHLYWTGANQDTSDVGRTPVGGGQQYESFSSKFGEPNPQPCGVAVDDKYLYFANPETSSIGRATLAGFGTNSQVIEGQWIQLPAAPNMTVKPCGVAIDATHVYWGVFQTVTNGVVSPGTTIGRALKSDGSGATDAFAGGGKGVRGLAIQGGFLYTSNWNDGGLGDGSIGRANLDGSGADANFITGLTAPYSVAADSGGPAALPPISVPLGPPPPSPFPVGCPSCGSGPGGPFSTIPPDFSRVWGTHTTFAPANWSTPLNAVAAGPALDARVAAAVAKGMVFNYALDKAGTVKITILRVSSGQLVRHRCRPATRHGAQRKCTLLVKVATLTRQSHKGINHVPFSGRIRGKALKPGVYRAVFVGLARTGKSVSKPKTLSLRIVGP